MLLEAKSLRMETDLDVLESQRLPGALLRQRTGGARPLAATQR